MDRSVFYIGLYVDDCIIMSDDLQLLEMTKQKLFHKFDMVDLRDVEYFLKIQVRRNSKKGIVHLSQSNYINDIIIRFKIDNCKLASFPMQINQHLFKTMTLEASYELKEMESTSYSQSIGCLLHFGLFFVVSKLAQFISNLGMIH